MADSLLNKKEQSGSEKAKEYPQEKKPAPQILAPTINEAITGKLQLERQNQLNKGEHQFYENPEVWLVLVTVALVWVTARLVRFTKNLWESTNKLVVGSEDTAKIQLRAYVAIESVTYTVDPPRFPKIEIRNYGKSPAYDVTIRTGAKIISCGEDVSTLETAQLAEPQMICPDQIFGRHSVFSMEHGGDEKFHMYGGIYYRDIYNRWWVTRFCFFHESPNRFVVNGNYNREDGPYEKRPS